MQKQIVFRIYGIAFLATIIMLFIFVFLNRHFDGTIWNDMQISKSALTAEYCELNQTNKLFHQSSNTYSNLAYFFLGMLAILISFYDRKDKSNLNKNLIQQFPLVSFFFGCCLIYLCFGSSFFHASLTWVGQRVDMNGTYSICITLIGMSGYRLFSKEKPLLEPKTQRFIILFLVVTIAAFVGLHLLVPSTILLPLIVGILITLTTINYFKNKEKFNVQLAILSLLLMIAAFALRTIDVKKIACNPTSLYQGHALWHVFTSMSAFLLYWFYRSEKV